MNGCGGDDSSSADSNSDKKSPGKLAARFKLKLDFDTYNEKSDSEKTEFKKNITEQLATAIDIKSSDIKITNIKSGSLIVELEITVPSTTTLDKMSEKINNQLQKSDSTFVNGLVTKKVIGEPADYIKQYSIDNASVNVLNDLKELKQLEKKSIDIQILH